MEDIVAACLADKESQGECSKLAPEVDGEKGPSNIEGSSLGPGNCDKALPSEEALKEKATVAGGAFESPKISGVTGDDNKGRRAVPSETRFVNSPHLDQALDENNSRERQSAPEIPHLEALGKKEKLCNVENVEVRGPEEAATLQETRLPGLGGVRTEACLNREGTAVKALLSPVEFAGPVSVFWEQGTSRSPNGPDPGKEEEELCSIHTTAGNDPVAGERVGETPVSNEDGSDEHSAVSLNGTGVQNKNSNNAKIMEISRSEKGVTSTGSNGIDTEIHCAIEETQENGSLVEMGSPDYSDRQKSSSVDALRIPEVWGVQPDPSPLSSMTPEKEQEKPRKDKDEEISSVGKKMDPDPAQETRREGEEEETLVHQPKGVQIVCYNMCGSVVRLLGAPSKAHKTSGLKRLLELEDSSAGEKMSEPNWGVTSSRAPRARKRARLEGSEHVSNEGSADLQPAQKEIKDSDCNAVLPKKTKRLQKPYAAHILWQRPLNSDDDNEKRRRRRARSLPKEASVSVPSLPLSAEQIRVKVIDSLRGMLQKRLEESLDLDVPEDTIMRLANNIEKEIFRRFLCVDQRYKNKYRSLLFNLRAPKNKLLFQQVVLGEVTPQCLVQMNSLEMAPKELAEWRAREHKQVLEVIEKQQQEAPMRCSTKLTHKGEIEIHREMEENVTLEDLFESVLCMETQPIPQSATESEKDTTDQHKSHLLDLDSHICAAQPGPDGEEGFNPPRNKLLTQKKEAELFRKLHSTRVCSARRSQHSENKRPVSSGILRKKPRLQKPLDKSTVLWEGSIQMFSIKEFSAKAYPVSGYSSHLVQALPAQIQSRGCTLPEDVWDFLDSIWPAEAKEMSVIRFYPAVAQAMGTYNMLYTYLNNKQRYGIVDSKQMEMFLVPLPAFQPVPAKFHPQGGPGGDWKQAGS
ncbi:SPOC domain-containing protein 1 isoform B [Alligator mississippiensis]|uniref:SPOC domain-containing protein 1 isoform B n=1 Tax=Alligator mississippiensis TaxID=8496 RepID=A0A151MN25_ALLMI|nr:SPOC domain-containing protein 1 isoform B [Alligator mississippiensis]